VDGQQVATESLSGAAVDSASPLRFGGNAVWGEWFQGSLDDVRIYDRALGAGEIQADMETPVGEEPAPGPTPAPPPTPTPPPPPAAADVFIAPSGSDSNACTSVSPCASFSHAYDVASAGDVISVGSGLYTTPQEVPAGSKAVTFRGQSGNKLRELDNYADNITFDSLDIDGNGAVNNTFENHDGNNDTFKNSRIGHVTDEKGALVSGDHFTFDNMVFHDVDLKTDGVHLECVFAIGVPNMVVKNSTFTNCSVMDLFFTYGNWWTPTPPAYGGVTVENNVFGHVMDGANDGWNYYPMYIGQTGDDVLRNWTVRYNTFEQPASLTSSHSSAVNSRWVGNLGGWDCIDGMAYSHNVGDVCGSTDKKVSPDQDTPSQIAPFGWMDPRNGDFHLRADSVALNAGDPSNHPATDRDGNPRGSTPDAGAYER
jgi:hypothetical protein